MKRLIQSLGKVFSSPMAYLSLSDHELSHNTVHVLIGVFWEELLFTLLLRSVPYFSLSGILIYQGLTSGFTTLIILSLILINLWFHWISIKIIVILHQPGHFFTEYKIRRAKRLLRKMEGAWLWQNIKLAQRVANELRPLVVELWVLTEDNYYRFLQYVCLYVICHHNPEIGETDSRRLLMEELAISATMYPNEITNT